MLNFYISISYFFHFFSNLFLKIRLLKKKEDPYRYQEKLGKYKVANDKNTIWFNASSLGEIKSIVPLILHFANKQNLRILVTTSTLSSSQYFHAVFNNSPNVIHQFSPLDTPIIVKRFLKHWKPRVSIFIESELWPNLIMESKKTSSLILLNARLSKKSFARWKLVKSLARFIFEQFDSITAQSKEAKSFIEYFNIKNIIFFGNLKFCSMRELPNDNVFNFKKKLNYSWVAMSTHRGEEEFVIAVSKIIKEKKIISQCILIPRHIERIKEILDLLKLHNCSYQLKSEKPESQADNDFYIVDSYGDTKKIFEQINLVFLGGSIINHGGQNPLEAAKEGCSVFHGPHIHNFSEIYEFLDNNGISTLVKNQHELATSLILNFEKPSNNQKFKDIMKDHSKTILLDHINYLNSFIK